MHDTDLGELDNNSICQELSTSVGKKRKPQSTYSDEDRYIIAKCAKYHGISQAAKFFKNKYPKINESTVRTFVRKYEQKVPKDCGQAFDDEKVRKFMVLLYKNVGHASRSITVTTAMVLLSRTDDESVKNVVVTSTFFCREYGFEDERQLLAKLNTGERKERSRFTASLSHNKYN